MKVLRSVISLSFRNWLMSLGVGRDGLHVFWDTLRCERMALAAAAESSSCSCRSRYSLMRAEASAITTSVVYMKCQMRPSFRFTSSSSSSMV